MESNQDKYNSVGLSLMRIIGIFQSFGMVEKINNSNGICSSLYCQLCDGLNGEKLIDIMTAEGNIIRLFYCYDCDSLSYEVISNNIIETIYNVENTYYISEEIIKVFNALEIQENNDEFFKGRLNVDGNNIYWEDGLTTEMTIDVLTKDNKFINLNFSWEAYGLNYRIADLNN